MEEWAQDVVKAARHARDRRARGEPLTHPVDQLSGLEICGEAVSYKGHPPPEPVRVALRRLTHERETDGLIPAELVEKYNSATREVLRRAIARFIEETNVAPRAPCGGRISIRRPVEIVQSMDV